MGLRPGHFRLAYMNGHNSGMSFITGMAYDYQISTRLAICNVVSERENGQVQWAKPPSTRLRSDNEAETSTETFVHIFGDAV